MLRLYDTDLIERLNRRYTESRSRYESKNHFFTDLIEGGLNRRKYENDLHGRALESDTAMCKSVDELSERLRELEKYVRTQFQSVGAANFLVSTLLSNIYFLSAASNNGIKISLSQLDNGTYNILPERFKKMKETTERIFVKDE